MPAMPPHHYPQQQQPHMNKSAVDAGVYLMRRATEEDAKLNFTASYELFFAALDSFLFAMPIHLLTHERRLEIQSRLSAYVDKFAQATGVAVVEGEQYHAVEQPYIVTEPVSGDDMSMHCSEYQYEPPAPQVPPPTLSDTVVAAAVAGAVALKQSPIPDAVSSALSLGLKSLQSIDSQYKLRDKLVGLGKAGVQTALQVDRQYGVHQRVGDAMLTGLTAFTQAAVAYRNAPAKQPEQQQRSSTPRPVQPVALAIDADAPHSYITHGRIQYLQGR
ncbi:hypothetical protein RI367_007610 [Sorochytrium milnesiophthora]